MCGTMGLSSDMGGTSRVGYLPDTFGFIFANAPTLAWIWHSHPLAPPNGIALLLNQKSKGSPNDIAIAVKVNSKSAGIMENKHLSVIVNTENGSCSIVPKKVKRDIEQCEQMAIGCQ